VYSVLSYQECGPVLCFSFATPGIEEHEWHHTVLGHPISEWLDKALLPLAMEEKENLTAKQVVTCVTELAAKELIPATAIDWLGLALLASQRYREIAIKLATSDSIAIQEQCSAVSALVPVLSDVSERFAQVIYAKLREFPRNAA